MVDAFNNHVGWIIYESIIVIRKGLEFFYLFTVLLVYGTRRQVFQLLKCFSSIQNVAEQKMPARI